MNIRARTREGKYHKTIKWSPGKSTITVYPVKRIKRIDGPKSNISEIISTLIELGKEAKL